MYLDSVSTEKFAVTPGGMTLINFSNLDIKILFLLPRIYF